MYSLSYCTSRVCIYIWMFFMNILNCFSFSFLVFAVCVVVVVLLMSKLL